MSPSGGNSAPAVALYVFSGPHLGARLELAEGSWVLGSDDSCDIILSGLAPRHALLEAAAGESGMTVSLSPLDGSVRPQGGKEIFPPEPGEQASRLAPAAGGGWYLGRTCFAWNLPDAKQTAIEPETEARSVPADPEGGMRDVSPSGNEVAVPEPVVPSESDNILSAELSPAPVEMATPAAVKGKGGLRGRVVLLALLAVILGARSLRHDATAGYEPGSRSCHGFDDALTVIAPACREITEYAAEKGVRTMVENHGFFCQDSERVERLVNTVAHENFGLLTDMGNFLCADENPAAAFGRVAPYAFYVHAKDFYVKSGNGFDPGEGFFRSRSGNYLRGAIVGQGDVPLRHCLSALKAVGYTGAVAIEFEGMEDCLTGLRIGLANLRRALADVGL